MKEFTKTILLPLMMLVVMHVPVSVYAVGESSMITLEFPAGAENTGLAESGVSLSNSINTMFWNPAALPAVYDNLQTRIQAGYFSEHPLKSKGVDHNYITGALFFNGLLPMVDFAYGFYRNTLKIGDDNERVFSNSIGVRALNIFSFGISLKTFSSYKTPISLDSIGTKLKSSGLAFDLGGRIEYTARIASTPVTILPELGLSLVNLGRDSAVDFTDEKKPLPRGFFIGGSFTTQFLEFFSYTMAAQARASLLKLKSNGTDSSWTDYHYDGGHDLLVSLGNRFQITPFYSYGFGYMVDYNGRRFEFHDVHTFTFDARKVMAILYRIKNRDFEPESENIQKVQEKWSIYNGKIKPNIRFSYSTSDINSIDGNARDGQQGIDFSFGF